MAGEVKFSKPDKGPFDDVDAKPDFEVAAVVPLTSGFSPGFVNLYISLFNVDRGVYGYLNVSGPNGRRAAGSYFDTVLSGLRHRDPKMEMTLSPGGLEF